MSLVNHSHYATFGDLGIFNQGIWQFSRFQWPYITFHLHRPFLGDHFDPIVILLAPFYWIYPSEKILLILQPFIMLSAIIPLFLIGYKFTRSLFFSLSIVIAYSLYIPVQYTIFYDFHDIVFAPPLFAWAYYFFSTKRRFLVSILLIFLLLTKEEVGFFVAVFGLYLLIFHKNWRRFGLFWLFIGNIYSLLMMYWVIPTIGDSYLYFNYGSSGQTPLDVVINTIKNPLGMLTLFFDSPIKRETLSRTFWPFAYLPLFSPLGFLLSFEQLFTRFIDQRTIIRWTIGYHYSAILTVVVAIGTIWSAGFYSKFFPRYRSLVIVLLGILLIVLTRVEQINASAVFLVKRPQFWARDAWMDNLDKAITLIPKSSSVATQNNIIPHLSTRENIYSLSDIDKAEYVLVDFRTGQSTFNFLNNEERKETEKRIRAGIENGKYKVIFNEGQVYLITNK